MDGMTFFKNIFKKVDEKVFYKTLQDFKESVSEDVFEKECGKYFTDIPSMLDCWLQYKQVKAPRFRIVEAKRYGIRELLKLQSKTLSITVQVMKGIPRLKEFIVY